MRKPRARTPGRTYTISATDEEWEAIRAGAQRAGKRISTWAVECALTVDPLPRQSRRLVLDEKQQRSISRSMDAHARSLCADADTPSGLADDLRKLLEARLGAMARRGRAAEAVTRLRETFGERRAEIVIAAMMPVTGKTGSTVEPAEKPAAKEPPQDPERKPSDQDDLFGPGDRPIPPHRSGTGAG